MDLGELGQCVDKVLMRKLLSQPARFSLPRMEPLPGSKRARFSASFRSRTRFSVLCPFRFRAWSSLQVASNTRCSRLSIPQCPRAKSLHRSGGQTRLSRQQRVSRPVSSFCRRVAVTLPAWLQTRPVMPLLQPSDAGADAGNTGFNASMPFADLGGLSCRRGRTVRKQPHDDVRRTLIAFQGQHAVPTLLHYLLRRLPLAVHSAGGNHLAPRVSSSGSWGTAVIPLDLSATVSCPNTNRCSSARALTRRRGERPSARS